MGKEKGRIIMATIPGLDIAVYLTWLIPGIIITAVLFVAVIFAWKFKLYRRWPFAKWPVNFHIFEKRAEGGISPKRDKYRTVRNKDGSEYGELLYADQHIPPISYNDLIQDKKGGLHFFCQRLEHDIFIPIAIGLGEMNMKNPFKTSAFLSREGAVGYIDKQKESGGWGVHKIRDRIFVPIKLGFGKPTPEFTSNLRDMKLASTMKSLGHRQVRMEYAKPSFFEKWGQHLMIIAFAVGASLFFYFLLSFGFIPALNSIQHMLDSTIAAYETAQVTGGGGGTPITPTPIT